MEMNKHKFRSRSFRVFYTKVLDRWLSTLLSFCDHSSPEPFIPIPFIFRSFTPGPLSFDRSYTDLSSLNRSMLWTVHTRTFQLGTFIHGPFISGPFIPFIHGPFISGPFIHGPVISGPFIHGPFSSGPFDTLDSSYPHHLSLDRSHPDRSYLDRSILWVVHPQTVHIWVVHTRDVHLWIVHTRTFSYGQTQPHGNTCRPNYWSTRKLGVHCLSLIHI